MHEDLWLRRQERSSARRPKRHGIDEANIDKWNKDDMTKAEFIKLIMAKMPTATMAPDARARLVAKTGKELRAKAKKGTASTSPTSNPPCG